MLLQIVLDEVLDDSAGHHVMACQLPKGFILKIAKQEQRKDTRLIYIYDFLM